MSRPVDQNEKDENLLIHYWDIFIQQSLETQQQLHNIPRGRCVVYEADPENDAPENEVSFLVVYLEEMVGKSYFKISKSEKKWTELFADWLSHRGNLPDMKMENTMCFDDTLVAVRECIAQIVDSNKSQKFTDFDTTCTKAAMKTLYTLKNGIEKIGIATDALVGKTNTDPGHATLLSRLSLEKARGLSGATHEFRMLKLDATSFDLQTANRAHNLATQPRDLHMTSVKMVKLTTLSFYKIGELVGLQIAAAYYQDQKFMHCVDAALKKAIKELTCNSTPEEIFNAERHKLLKAQFDAQVILESVTSELDILQKQISIAPTNDGSKAHEDVLAAGRAKLAADSALAHLHTTTAQAAKDMAIKLAAANLASTNAQKALLILQTQQHNADAAAQLTAAKLLLLQAQQTAADASLAALQTAAAASASVADKFAKDQAVLDAIKQRDDLAAEQINILAAIKAASNAAALAKVTEDQSKAAALALATAASDQMAANDAANQAALVASQKADADVAIANNTLSGLSALIGGASTGAGVVISGVGAAIGGAGTNIFELIVNGKAKVAAAALRVTLAAQQANIIHKTFDFSHGVFMEASRAIREAHLQQNPGEYDYLDASVVPVPIHKGVVSVSDATDAIVPRLQESYASIRNAMGAVYDVFGSTFVSVRNHAELYMMPYDDSDGGNDNNDAVPANLLVLNGHNNQGGSVANDNHAEIHGMVQDRARVLSIVKQFLDMVRIINKKSTHQWVDSTYATAPTARGNFVYLAQEIFKSILITENIATVFYVTKNFTRIHRGTLRTPQKNDTEHHTRERCYGRIDATIVSNFEHNCILVPLNAAPRQSATTYSTKNAETVLRNILGGN